MNTPQSEQKSYEKTDRYILGITAIISAVMLLLLGILGPLGLDVIRLKTNQSGVWQLQGQDLANLILLTPICLLGGILHLKKNPIAKYFLVFPALTLIYTGLSYGIGQEWSHPDLTGNYNGEMFFWIFLLLIIGGLIMIVFGLPLFSAEDAPEYNSKSLKRYAITVMIFLGLFGLMWFKEIFEVIQNGDTANGSYSATPVLFWVIKYMDLGFSIPMGFIAMYFLITRPKKAFPLTILFFGFFIGMATAVNSMGWMMFFNHDPALQNSALIIFGILFILSVGGFFYIFRPKLRK